MKLIGEVSRLCGVGVETIRYYEREGIVPKPDRLSNGRRAYDSCDIARLRFVKKCRDLGFPMKDVRSLQDLAFSGGSDCQGASEIGRQNLEAVRSKIRQLAKLEQALSELIVECDSNPDQCPMLNQLMLD